MTAAIPLDFNVQATDFVANASMQGNNLHIHFHGTADMRVWATMKAFLTSVHGEAIRLGIAQVQVDMRDLEFMNSSCFKNFVTWLQSLRALPENQRYRVEFAANNKRHWQARSLGALSTFAAGLVSISAS